METNCHRLAETTNSKISSPMVSVIGIIEYKIRIFTLFKERIKIWTRNNILK
jgi:hypothetical protein